MADNDERLTREHLLQRFEMFPMHLTSFILATSVVLEIAEKTSDIQSHFSTSSSPGGEHVRYDPSSIRGSYSSMSTSASLTCEATSNRCKVITIKLPQIIGWVSQTVPVFSYVAPAEL